VHKVEVTVSLKPDILDPQGKTVQRALSHMSYDMVKSARVGKSIVMDIDAPSPEKALEIAREVSNKLLANPVMEVFSVRLIEGN